MAAFCLRRLLAFFLAFVLVAAVDNASSAQPTASVSASSSSPSVSVRGTTMYIISQSFTYDPATISTTVILETILPTTRLTHALPPLTSAASDASSSATLTPSSPFDAVATPSQQSSSAGPRLSRSGGLVSAVVVFLVMVT